MKSALIWINLLIMAFAMSIGSADNTAQYVNHPDRDKKLTEIQGMVQSIDVAARRLTVKDPGGQVVTVHVNQDARVMNSENHVMQWTSLHTGDKVLAYYDTATSDAMQIDLRPGVGEVLLGTPAP